MCKWRWHQILKPDGTTLASTFQCAGNMIGPVTLPATGTYTVFVDPWTTSTGQVTYALHNVADITGAIVIGGPPVTVNFITPGQRASLTFSGTAGQQVSLVVNSSTLGGFCASGDGTKILKPDGTTLASTFQCAGNMIGPVTLPATGTYTVFVDPWPTSHGIGALMRCTM